ncbi:MAG: flavin reductase family protein [Bacteroidetes bacterium]|nr:flavin reductase family protein [Bacteroidota bacterium]
MITINPADIPHREMHSILLSGVAPRPIALVSTMDSSGNINLSPFSFFNSFGSKPPIIAIGPAFSAATGKAKDTYLNIIETGECTVNAVQFSMVEQINLASCEYERGVDEFIKSGLTKRSSELVRPPMVAESPFSMECRFIENIPLGRSVGGNGNLMLLEAVRFHIAESAMEDGKLHPQRLDLVARMGYNWYARAFGDAVFELSKPRWNGIGFDALPEDIRSSDILTGNNLARLAGVKELPAKDTNFPDFNTTPSADSLEIELQAKNPFGALKAVYSQNNELDRTTRHRIAQSFLDIGATDEAWQTLLL